MWRFLERWLAVAPREIAWVIVMPIPLLLVAIGCVLLFRLVSGSEIPEAMVTAIAYTAGVKVLTIMIVAAVGVIAAIGLAGLWLRRRWKRLF